MAETDRLGYSRGVFEQLRASHEHLSHEELLDLVCHLTKTYVLDATIPYDLPLPERAEELRADPPDVPESVEDTGGEPPAQRFARLIEELKRRTGLPQFEGFSVVDGRAVLTVDNQRITFGERVTIEFVPRSGVPARPGLAAPSAPSAAPVAGRRSPGATPTVPGASPARRPPGATPPSAVDPRLAADPAPSPPPAERPPEDDGYDPSVERFRRLDLD